MSGANIQKQLCERISKELSPKELLLGGTTLGNYDPITGAGFSSSGALPIQTPVSPNGKFVVTGNTLTATITIIDTETDELIKVLPCSEGDASDAMIVGRVILVADASTPADDQVSAHAGMGGQGVLPIPLVYNGWVQKLPHFWKAQLTPRQRDPIK